MLVVQRHFYCLIPPWLGSGSKVLGPFSAAWGSSGESVFLLEEGKGWTLEVRAIKEQQGWVNFSFFLNNWTVRMPFLGFQPFLVK